MSRAEADPGLTVAVQANSGQNTPYWNQRTISSRYSSDDGSPP